MSDRYAKYNKLKFDYPADRVLRITFDRPESFNSVDAETHTQMTDMWIDIDNDPDINAVIVTGAGKAFSAGGDFSLIENMIGNSQEIMKTWKEARGLVYNIINCNKPIISAINGPAAGAGLVVGLLADISIAGKKAKIVDGHPRLGVAAGDVAAIIWPLLTSMAKAKYYLMTCKPVSGEEAERIGLNAAAWARDALSPASIDAYTEALIRGAAAREAVELSAPASDDELIYKAGAAGQYVHLNGTDHKGRRLDVHCPASEAAQELLEVSDARTLARQYFESANAALEVARRGGNLRRYKRPN